MKTKPILFWAVAAVALGVAGYSAVTNMANVSPCRPVSPREIVGSYSSQACFAGGGIPAYRITYAGRRDTGEMCRVTYRVTEDEYERIIGAAR